MVKVLLLSLALVGLAVGCSDTGAKESEVLHLAPILAYVRVSSTKPNPKKGPDSYTAKLELLCTLKGGQLNSTLFIPDAGFAPGLCRKVELEEGKEYYLALSHSKDLNYDSNWASMPATEETRQKLIKHGCDLATNHPTDGMAAHKHTHSLCSVEGSKACTGHPDHKKEHKMPAAEPSHDHSEHDHSKHDKEDMKKHDHDHDGKPDHNASEHDKHGETAGDSSDATTSITSPILLLVTVAIMFH